MGGKALKTVKLRRANTKEFWYIYNTIIQPVLFDLNIKSIIPRYYNLKEDHGDMDIVLCMENNHTEVMKIIKLFNPKEIYAPVGCNCYSFEIFNFQIDFLVSTKSNFEASYHFFSHGDLHNLLGKMYHQFSGLKMGWDGLKYPYYDSKNQRIGNIYLTKDYKKIYEFLGLDYNDIEKGFDTLEDMFEYVIKCKYFTTKSYEQKNMRSIDKKRNQHRPGFIAFKEYINKLDSSFNRDFINVDIQKLKEFFGVENWDEQEKVFQTKMKNTELFKNKWNGKLITNLTGLTGKNLGLFMKKFINKFSNGDKDNFQIFIINIQEKTLETLIKNNI